MVSKREVIVRGGCGGNGLISFRREKYNAFGGPDGGDGGDGGSLFVMASPGVDDLSSLKQKEILRAENGGQGGNGQKHGKKGEDLTISVPVGTMVFAESTRGKELIADLTIAGQRILVAKGGRGGLGNARFATAVNQAPEIASKGEPGEERHIILELKLITDICIIGSPNSGKSALLSAISRARPQITDYPFATQQPVLGILTQTPKMVRGKAENHKRDLVIAEIPGIIAGAHSGKGLGNEFLRHVERTRLLIYLLDGSSSSIRDDLNNLVKELELYKADLSQKPKIVAVNKVDLPQVQARLPDIRQELGGLEVPIFYISAVSGQGVTELADKAMEMVEQASQEEEAASPQIAVFRPRPKR